MAEPAQVEHDVEHRCGFVALIGAPNVGKSTLVNALVGAKVSIVTPKVQTTRTLIRGIAIVDGAQLIFVDTPGIFSPRRRLDRAMVGTALGSTHDADLVAVVIDSRRGLADDDERILRELADLRAPKVLVLNKIDLIGKPALLALTHKLNESANFAATFMISALSGDGVTDLKHWLAANVPAGPWLYPEDQLSDAPLLVAKRGAASEVRGLELDPGSSMTAVSGNRSGVYPGRIKARSAPPSRTSFACAAMSLARTPLGYSWISIRPFASALTASMNGLIAAWYGAARSEL